MRNISTTIKMLQSVDFEVFGRVQGVFFRKFTRDKGKELGLKGWCMNTYQGTVTGTIQGKEEKIEEMKDWLRHTGSPMSKIDKCVFSNDRHISKEEFQDFHIKKANYNATRKLLTRVADSSSLESGSEFKPRKRKRKLIRLRGEKSMSDEANYYVVDSSSLESGSGSEFKPRKRRRKLIHLRREDLRNYKSEIAPKSIKHSYPVPSTPSSSHNTLNSNKNLNTYSSPSSLESSDESNAATPGCSEQPLRSLGSNSMKHCDQELNDEIEQIKLNQAVMWSALTEFKEKAQHIDEKLDRILTILEDKKDNSQILYPNIQNEEMGLILSLPVGMENFSELNETIATNSSFRQRLISILNVVGGRDGKAFTSNILRKLISDDVGENFSLTGKCSKNGIAKGSFEKTEIYKLILEICFRTFNSKENQIREVISDWLMQSKFRKIRREKRRDIQEEGECHATDLIEKICN